MRKCSMSVKLADYNSHTCSFSKLGVCEELPVETTLNKGQDEPLTAIEEKLKSKLARRAISQSSQSLLSIKTGGQVKYTDTHTIQPIILVPVPSPHVTSNNASQRTKHRQAVSLQVVPEAVSGGCDFLTNTYGLSGAAGTCNLAITASVHNNIAKQSRPALLPVVFDIRKTESTST